MHKAPKRKHSLPILLITILLVAIQYSCESFLFYKEPIQYPALFTFTGNVWAEDSTPIQNIRIVMVTPSGLDSNTTYTDTFGVYLYTQKLEYGGPNKIRVRDVDGPDYGGTFQGVDTTFYMRQEDWDDMVVTYNFVLRKR